MNAQETLQKIHQVGIIPVIRAASAEEAFLAVEAMEEGGIHAVEITMTVPGAIEVIRRVCFEAGAEFLVSPGISIAVLRAAHAKGKLYIPGALTPSEIMIALDEGAPAIKIFPCGSVGGAKHIKALRGPFPNVALIPTGGVNAGNAAEFFAAGAFAIGAGSELVDAAALRAGRKNQVAAAARELVSIVQTARTK
jgi:2-dehydro-3-deoxyphosphogluconate aldolase/(4S)-4-hydroxy-2-oxoglutarate aldolase